MCQKPRQYQQQQRINILLSGVLRALKEMNLPNDVPDITFDKWLNFSAIGEFNMSIEEKSLKMVMRIYIAQYNYVLHETIEGIKNNLGDMIDTFRQICKELAQPDSTCPEFKRVLCEVIKMDRAAKIYDADLRQVLKTYLEKYSNDADATIEHVRSNLDTVTSECVCLREHTCKIKDVSHAIMNMNVPDDVLDIGALHYVLEVYLKKYDSDVCATTEGVRNDLDNMIDLYRKVKKDTYNNMSGYQKYKAVLSEEDATERRYLYIANKYRYYPLP
jgi:hypothetical protein